MNLVLYTMARIWIGTGRFHCVLFKISSYILMSIEHGLPILKQIKPQVCMNNNLNKTFKTRLHPRKQSRSTEASSKLKNPETRQVHERLAWNLEHLQVPKLDRTRCPEEWTSSVGISTRCKCSMETSRNEVKVKLGNKVQISNRVENWYNVWPIDGVNVYVHPLHHITSFYFNILYYMFS